MQGLHTHKDYYIPLHVFALLGYAILCISAFGDSCKIESVQKLYYFKLACSVIEFIFIRAEPEVVRQSKSAYVFVFSSPSA